MARKLSAAERAEQDPRYRGLHQHPDMDLWRVPYQVLVRGLVVSAGSIAFYALGPADALERAAAWHKTRGPRPAHMASRAQRSRLTYGAPVLARASSPAAYWRRDVA